MAKKAKEKEIRKITSEELEQIKDQQSNIQRVLIDLGSLEAKKIEVLDSYKDFLSKLEVTKKELEEKYGQVNINLTDGSYTEIEETGK
jgi:hypothetical protein|tara:strand:+ start:67 stop:330 length:264 start_codon:yes stop_codon:yes gene_type:complete